MWIKHSSLATLICASKPSIGMSDGRKRFAKHVGLQIRVTELLDNVIKQLTYFIFTFVLFLCTVTYEDNKIKQYLKCLHLFEMLIHSY